VNSKNDRESPNYQASDYVKAITDSLVHHSTSLSSGMVDISQLLTHVVYLEGGLVELDNDNLTVRFMYESEDMS
jgi:hypothetical protein